METNADSLVHQPRRPVSRLVALAASALLLVSLGAATFFYRQVLVAREEMRRVAAREAALRGEVHLVVEKLGAIVLLPEGETPMLSTVTHREALAESQEFFRNANNGDKVLVYPRAQKAFLYRPGENKLINVAPVYIEKTAADASPIPTVAGEVDQR